MKSKDLNSEIRTLRNIVVFFHSLACYLFQLVQIFAIRKKLLHVKLAFGTSLYYNTEKQSERLPFITKITTHRPSTRGGAIIYHTKK